MLQDEETASSFFIPRRKRTVSVAAATVTTEKKRRLHYDDGVLIFDEDKGGGGGTTDPTTQSMEADDVCIASAPSMEALERKKESAMVSALYAINMFMEPANVMHATLYWLSQYVNYKLVESQWFNDHIQGLMLNPVQLSMSSSQGIAYIHARLPKYTLLLHLCGSNLHKIPSEYFVHNDCVQILQCLRYFMTSENECFLTRNTFGLKGEVELATFQYNRVLSYFYEPSFFIITSYLLYVQALLSLKHGRQLSFFLPAVKNITKAIQHKRIPWDNLLCLNVLNSNYMEKRRVFEQDMIDLRATLSHMEVDLVMDELTSLWSKKASYVTDLIESRHNAIYSQLYQ